LESQIILVLGSKTTKGLILPMPVGVEKIKNKNTTLSEQVQISTIKIVKRGNKIDLPNTQIHDRALS
jgi:hypothetical protein